MASKSSLSGAAASSSIPGLGALRECWRLLRVDEVPDSCKEPPRKLFSPSENAVLQMAFDCKPHLSQAIDMLQKVAKDGDDLRVELQAANSNRQDLRDKLDKANNDRQDLRGKLDKANADCLDLQGKLKTAGTVCQDFRMTLDTANTNLQVANDDRQDLQDRLQAANNDRQDLQDKLQMANDDRQDLRDKLQTAEAGLQALQQMQHDQGQQLAAALRELDQINRDRQAVEAKQVEQRSMDDKLQADINAGLVLLSVTIPDIHNMIALSTTAEEQTEASTGGQPDERSGQVFGISDSAEDIMMAAAAATSSTNVGSSSSNSEPSLQLELPPYHDSLKRDTIVVSFENVTVGSGATFDDGWQRARKALELFGSSPKIPVIGRYKTGKSTLLMKLLGYPNSKCMQNPVTNTKGLNLYFSPGVREPIFIDAEGFSQPIPNVDPYFMRDFVVHFCAMVSRCMLLVVNNIDIADLQLIKSIRNVARGTIVVVHNLVTTTAMSDIQEYKRQVMKSLNLTEDIGCGFGLVCKERNEVHYVVGNLASDADWNITSNSETVFGEIKRVHCHGYFDHSLETSLRDSFSKVVSKYFEPITRVTTLNASDSVSSVEAAYFRSLEWERMDEADRSASRRIMVLKATYATQLQRAFEMRDLQPHSSITWVWLRSNSFDPQEMRAHLVVNCPGFVLKDLKFLSTMFSDERTILLIGLQYLYGRAPLPVRELVKSPVALIQTEDKVQDTLQNLKYDNNGSIMLPFFPNVQSGAALKDAIKTEYKIPHGIESHTLSRSLSFSDKN